MISSLQPSRPRASPRSAPHYASAPNRQPFRHIASSSFPPQTSPPFYQPPRTQLEAMPPISTSSSVFDSSIRHPVFFTERLKKAPEGVNAGGGGWSSPVAEGYVFNDGTGMARRVEGVKL